MKKFIIILLLVFPTVTLAQTCFCVSLARTFNSAVPRLDAEYWYMLSPMTRSAPSLGGQILMKYETEWDVATIVDFTDKGFIVAGVDFDTCGVTRRIIEFSDPRIRAFFYFG